MKKKLAFLVAAALLLTTLAACGGNENAADDNEKANQDVEVSEFQESEKSEPRVIELDPPVMLYQDEYVTVEVVDLHEKVNWDRMAKCLTLKTTNTCDREVLVSIMDAYLGDENVQVSTAGDGPVLPGKNKTTSYHFQYKTQPETTELENLEDLFQLDGKLEIFFFDEDGTTIVHSVEPLFDLEEAT
ncbi:hypothetical protein [Intestinibacillus sp. Marseille-P6563]|uniref:hypothetical protein n=1 Tax=Intestinibacillus sp. Marseille-P6563 TaxID=2364792 RepID=UPI000F05BCB9|nr:hypothetical protein [Intestinibacillus sp. Marseille-P6563]